MPRSRLGQDATSATQRCIAEGSCQRGGGGGGRAGAGATTKKKRVQASHPLTLTPASRQAGSSSSAPSMAASTYSDVYESLPIDARHDDGTWETNTQGSDVVHAAALETIARLGWKAILSHN